MMTTEQKQMRSTISLKKTDSSITKWCEAVDAIKSGQPQVAISLFKEIGDTSRMNFNIAMMYRKQKKYEEAIHFFSRCYAQDKYCGVAIFMRAESFLHLQKYRLAVLDYTLTLNYFKKERTEIDYRQLGLFFMLSRVEVLYNRAIAFCCLELFHRARDDLAEVLQVKLKYGRNSVVQDLMNFVANQLKKQPTHSIIQAPDLLPLH